jgi:hypothetical protein
VPRLSTVSRLGGVDPVGFVLRIGVYFYLNIFNIHITYIYIYSLMGDNCDKYDKSLYFCGNLIF